MSAVTERYVPVSQDPRKMGYIAWLTTPPGARNPKTEKELAVSLGVSTKTLYHWRHERDFREVWSDETDTVVGGDDKRQRVLDTLYQAAIDTRNPRHVAAAKVYLDSLRAMSPEGKVSDGRVKAVGLLSDEELERLVAIGAAELRAEQTDAGG